MEKKKGRSCIVLLLIVNTCRKKTNGFLLFFNVFSALYFRLWWRTRLNQSSLYIYIYISIVPLFGSAAIDGK